MGFPSNPDDARELLLERGWSRCSGGGDEYWGKSRNGKTWIGDLRRAYSLENPAGLKSYPERAATAPETSKVVYRTILPDAVDADTVKAARAGRALAVAHLSLDSTPGLSFFIEETESDREYRKAHRFVDDGFHKDGAWWESHRGAPKAGHANRIRREIAVRIGDDYDDPQFAAETAAHEVFHLAQGSKAHVAGAEEDAEAYAKWAGGVLAGSSWRVHGPYDGVPVDGLSLRGMADYGDIAVTFSGDKADVYRNAGSSDCPYWVKHYAACPVPLAGRD
jgi:hypothetical protein